MANPRKIPLEARAGFAVTVREGFGPSTEADLRTSIRPTVAEVDLGAIARNVDRIATTVAPAAIWAVVKADAYGHGAVPVARSIADRCDGLAVSLVEEGLELRAAGVRIPIAVLGAFYDHCHELVLAERLIPVVYDPNDLDLFSEAARARGKRADVHLKVDTGMNRLGVTPADLPAVLDRIDRLPDIRLAGLATQLASADEPAGGETAQALALFRQSIDLVRARGWGPLVCHAANSAAAVRFPDARFDAVRPGLEIYGAMSSAAAAFPGIEPALRFTTRIMALRQVPAGAAVSYGALWRAPRPSVVATLPVGYADGYPRHVRGASTLVRGRRAPLVGAVCMDMLMVDVSDVPGVAVGDAVTLIGPDGGDAISVDDLASWAGTISYEILCGVSKRVPRIYKDAR